MEPTMTNITTTRQSTVPAHFHYTSRSSTITACMATLGYSERLGNLVADLCRGVQLQRQLLINAIEAAQHDLTRAHGDVVMHRSINELGILQQRGADVDRNAALLQQALLHAQTVTLQMLVEHEHAALWGLPVAEPMAECHHCGAHATICDAGSDAVGEPVCHTCARGLRDDCHQPLNVCTH